MSKKKEEQYASDNQGSVPRVWCFRPRAVSKCVVRRHRQFVSAARRWRLGRSACQGQLMDTGLAVAVEAP